MNRKLRNILSLAIVLVALLSVFLFGKVNHIVKNEKRIIKEHNKKEVESKKRKIEAYLSNIEFTAKRLSDDLLNGRVNKHSVIDTLKVRLEKSVNLFEMAVVFAPYQYSKGQKLFGPYFKKKNGSLELLFADSLNGKVNDYTEKIPTNSWYNLPMEKKKGMWQEPYYDMYTDALIAEYTTPFYLSKADKEKHQPAGVICSGVTLDYLRKEIKYMDFGKTGYAMLVSEDGTIIHHPNRELVEKLKNIQDLAIEKKSGGLQGIADLVTKSQFGTVDYTSMLNKRKMVATVHPIDTLSLSLVTVINKNALTCKSDNYRKMLYYLSTSIVILLILIFTLMLSSKHWGLSISITSILLLGVISCLYIHSRFERYNTQNEHKIDSYYSLHTYIDNVEERIKPISHIEVPTGLFIQSINFNSANDFIATGYVWQVYNGEYNENTGLVTMFGSKTEIKPGIIFPENEEMTLTMAYSKKQEESTVIGWYFKGKIRERFEYTDFPFDKEQFWIRMWHEEFDKYIVLVPDFDSYSTITPDSKPGIENDLVLPGWNAKSSYYTYVESSYNTNFGINNYVGQYDFPELHFNILVERKILDKFISYFVPVLIVLFMLYAILILGRTKVSNSLLGFNSSASVSACSALFFVIIFNHINLREELLVPGIVYMEYFYFVSYIGILFVSVNSILLVFGKESKFIHYKDNHISRLIFWPVIVLIIYILTLGKFL